MDIDKKRKIVKNRIKNIVNKKGMHMMPNGEMMKDSGMKDMMKKKNMMSEYK